MYKVRLEDGEVYGPMPEDVIRRWMREGRVFAHTPILVPGSAQWSTVEAALLRPPPKEAPEEPGLRHWGSVAAGTVVLIAGLLSLARAILPDEILPDLIGGPWVVIGAANVVIGGLLLSETRVVRHMVLGLLGLDLLFHIGLAAVLIGTGVSGPPLQIVGFGVLFLVAIGTLILVREPNGILLAACLGTALLGIGGSVWAALAPNRALQAAIAKHARPERSISNEALGYTLDLPEGWVALRVSHPLYKVPGCTLALVDARRGAFGLLIADENGNRAPFDAVLDGIKEGLSTEFRDLIEVDRRDVKIGTLDSRAMRARWKDDDGRYTGEFTVWRDGFDTFVLITGMEARRAKKDVDAHAEVQRAVRMTGASEARITATVARLAAEVPLLSPRAADVLVRDVLKRTTVDAGQAYRAGVDALRRAVPRLPAAEVAEIGQVHNQLYAGLEAGHQVMMARYLETALTTPEEDLAAAAAVRAAVQRMSPETQKSLQGYYEKGLTMP